MQTPAPAASPLKEIIRVTAKPLCTAIRERVGPSVAALLENDDAIAQGTHFIFEMGRDEGRPWMQMDKLHLENDISKIVRNLEVVDNILDAKQTDANGNDRDTIEQLQKQLRAVADTQRAELNVLDGTLESEEMAELMNSDLPTGLTTLGFPLSKLAGDEISSSAAAFTSQEASDAAASGNTYSQLGAQGLIGIGFTKAVEADFTRSLLSVAASCPRLQSPLR